MHPITCDSNINNIASFPKSNITHNPWTITSFIAEKVVSHVLCSFICMIALNLVSHESTNPNVILFCFWWDNSHLFPNGSNLVLISKMETEMRSIIDLNYGVQHKSA